jgi:hypothetical protein
VSLFFEPLRKEAQTLFQLFPRFSESSHPPVEESDCDTTPYLENYSWDWVEFRFQPLKDLEIRSVSWVPDSSLICGEYSITNQTDQKREIITDMICTLLPPRAGNQMALSEIDGRPMLTGTLDDHKITLFAAGNPAFREDPFPFLRNRLSIAPHEVEKVRWVCILSDSRKAAREALTNVLKLDWGGEISHRKVQLESQLEISTGDADWDFILAHSQNLGLLRYHQLTSHQNRQKLSPIQGLMLLQALCFPNLDMVKNILDLVFTPPGQPDQSINIPESDQTPPLLAGELLWQIHQMGFPVQTWLPYLEKAGGWLEDWFAPGLDKDGDGIPELIHPQIFDLTGLRKSTDAISLSHLLPYPYLESPALGALLYNDLCRINDLRQFFESKTSPHLQQRKETLLNYLQDSWNPERGIFQNRDSRSHVSVEGFNIIENLQPGMNILRETFPQPTRIGVLHQRSTPSSPPGDFSIIFYGLDWQGNYRVEEHQSRELFSGKVLDWGFSECVYSKLDYCVLLDQQQQGLIKLRAPSTGFGDITQLLPLWAGALPAGQARGIFENIMLKPDRGWSQYGFSSRPEFGQEMMYLFWNFLLGQSLHNLGMAEASEQLIERWMEAIIPALEASGSSYPVYGINTGGGMGQEDSLESLFPIRFFLQVLGVELIQDNQLSIEGFNPFPWPVTLKFRGLEIRRERKQTSITYPGRETIILPEGEKTQIGLY